MPPLDSPSVSPSVSPSPLPPAPYIYVATRSAGVFFTDSYVDAGTQPIWVDVSTGLPSLACKEFHVDPTNPKGIQYVLTTSNILYKRLNGAAWTEILNATFCGYSNDVEIGGFCCDPTIPGKMWASLGGDGWGGAGSGYWVAYSDDYGDNWTLGTKFVNNWYLAFLGPPVAYGDTIHVSQCNRPFGAEDSYSQDGGATFSVSPLLTNGVSYLYFGYNYLTPSEIYHFTNGDGLNKYTIGGTTVTLQNIADHTQVGDHMWFDPINVGHQRFISAIGFHTTTDDWTNIVSINPLYLTCINPVDINGDIIVGLKLDHPNGAVHVIGVMTDEADATPSGVAGTNCHTTPFVDSIPDTCGGTCYFGIQAFMA